MHPARELRRSLVVFTILLAAASIHGQVAFVPNTTLSSQTANNTSASNSFKGLPDGVPAPQNTSKIGVRSLLYPGATTKLYAHYMGWFGASDHIGVGYFSNDPAQIKKQVSDMMFRGFSGVIASWDDHPMVRQSVPLLLKEVETRSGFEFAIEIEMPELNHYANVSGCDVTTKMIEILNDAYQRFQNGHAAYKRIDGRPVVFIFGGVNYYIDWQRVRSSVPGNPLLLFRNQSAFSSLSPADGAFSWTSHNATDPYGEELKYLTDFYLAASQSSKIAVGSAWAGFDDNSAAWGTNRINHPQCGRTWLHTLAEAGKAYNSAHQLQDLRVVTWNDYEENTAIESGIDNCLTVNANVNGNILSWTASGSTEETIHDYTIFMSIDGENLMKLKSVGPTTHSVDLSTFGFAPGTYIFYVKAIGYPSIHNQMSNTIKYSTSNKTPKAIMSLSAASGIAPLEVKVDLDGSSDTDGFIAAAQIDFGDGTIVDRSKATHNYQTPGTYTVIGTVTDNSTLYSRALATVEVPPANPGVVISAPQPGAALTAPFQFTATAELPAKIQTFKLKVDGNTVRTTFLSKLDRAVSVYNGSHTLTAEAIDVNGVIYSSSVNINVDTPSLDPIAGLTVSNLPMSATTVLACTVASSDPENKISKIVVDFGDGSAPVTGRSAIRTYASPGTYAVKATVYDATGRTNSVIKTVSVGGACAAPADNNKINLCSPLPGSVVTSPVAFRATGGTGITWMEAWVDGVKRYSQSGRTVDFMLPLSGGSHTVSVYGKTSGAVVDKGTATFTVQ